MNGFSVTEMIIKCDLSSLLAACLIVVVVILTGCQFSPDEQEFTVRNFSDNIIDVGYGVVGLPRSDQDRDYYSNLPLGAIDEIEYCAFCDIRPQAIGRIITFPFGKSHIAFFAARDRDTNELIFYEEYNYNELVAFDWIVPISDER